MHDVASFHHPTSGLSIFKHLTHFCFQVNVGDAVFFVPPPPSLTQLPPSSFPSLRSPFTFLSFHFFNAAMLFTSLWNQTRQNV